MCDNNSPAPPGEIWHRRAGGNSRVVAPHPALPLDYCQEGQRKIAVVRWSNNVAGPFRDPSAPESVLVGGLAASAVDGLRVSGCNSNTPPPPPKVISDKGTPYGDLLVPKLRRR